MRILRLAALAIVAIAAIPASASAALTAADVRIGNQPAFVRVVVEFTGGTLNLNAAQAADARPADGKALVELRNGGIVVRARDVRAFGVRARLSLAGANLARVRITGAAGRFKYVRVAGLSAPQRLVIDLYRTAPPSPSAEIRRGLNGCLELTSVQGSGSKFRVRGVERDVFEGSFVIRVRDASGKLVGRRIVTARGNWNETVSYDVPSGQSGTVEAVAGSSNDGSLACLVQVRVRLSG